jgi:hypothetical protein
MRSGVAISAKVDRINNSGNGIVEVMVGGTEKVRLREWNVGPISSDAVDHSIGMVVLSDRWALALTSCYLEMGYCDYVKAVMDRASISDFPTGLETNLPDESVDESVSNYSKGDKTTVRIDIVTDSIGIAIGDERSITVPSTAIELGERYPVQVTRLGSWYAKCELLSGEREKTHCKEDIKSDSDPAEIQIEKEVNSSTIESQTNVATIEQETEVRPPSAAENESEQTTGANEAVSSSGEASALNPSQSISPGEGTNWDQEFEINREAADRSVADSRRMTADRFYGGVNGRLEILRQMLEYVESNSPTEEDLIDWILSNSRAQSGEAVVHHLNFIKATGLIHDSDNHHSLTNRGKQYLSEEDPFVLYQALRGGVKGFETILTAMQNGPMSDEAIMDLLIGEFEECNMTTPGVAARHREWLEALGFVQGTDEGYALTDNGHIALDPSVPDEIDIGGSEFDRSRDSLREDDASQSRVIDVNPEVLQELRSEAEEIATDDPSRDGVTSTT